MNTYQDKPVLCCVKDTVGTRGRNNDETRQHESYVTGIEAAKKEISKFAATFSDKLQQRLFSSSEQNGITKLANTAFSMNSIIKSGTYETYRN